MSERFSFGAWVRQRRRVLDLTRDELAAQIGCSIVTIRHIEADERRPSKQLAAPGAGVVRRIAGGAGPFAWASLYPPERISNRLLPYITQRNTAP